MFRPRAEHDDLLLRPRVRRTESGKLREVSSREEERPAPTSQRQAERVARLNPQTIASPEDGDPGGLHPPSQLQLLHPPLKHSKDQDQVPQFARQREEKSHQEHG